MEEENIFLAEERKRRKIKEKKKNIFLQRRRSTKRDQEVFREGKIVAGRLTEIKGSIRDPRGPKNSLIHHVDLGIECNLVQHCIRQCFSWEFDRKELIN